MKKYNWNKLKNILLKNERGVGFEEVVIALIDGRLLDTVYHNNQKKYPQ